jgi:hypothetical protein
MVSGWNCVLELSSDRTVKGGSEAALADAIRRGADLRVGTEFIFNEHIDPGGDNPEVVEEVCAFRTTYLLDDRWVAGIMTLRMPVSVPDGFGQRPSMSFFMYNQNAQQAIARPHIDGVAATGEPGTSPLDDHSEMPKYHLDDNWDAGTNAPSQNFIYDFENYRFLVRDDWREVFAHGPDGDVVSGSLKALRDAFLSGDDIKVGIRGLCADLADDATTVLDHELFVHAGPGYYETETKRFAVATHPTVRVRPAVPLWYVSRGWDFGWLLARSDGHVAHWLCDPYTLKFRKSKGRHAIRWFVR